MPQPSYIPTRRRFIAGASAIPFALWLQSCRKDRGGGDGPQDTGPKVRYDARSPQGQAMLQIYADAVDAMKVRITEGDPSSWVFQWYIHGVRGDTDKSSELARIYPNPSPAKQLATDTWNTCQAHYFGDDENFFLPWHRMYVFFFEEIIRQVTNKPKFTLPYWNYSTPDPAIRGVLPPEFRDPTSPLFVAKRNPGVNDGDSIAKNNPGDLDLDALEQCTYVDNGAQPGFNMKLDFGLHGNVHVDTGNGQNMGSVPWAAGDPIFWVHHCNIDRLWASWNAAGRSNPTFAGWTDQKFVFADAAGQKVEATVGDFTAIAPLGYEYDQLESITTVCLPEAALQARLEASALRAMAPEPIPLGPGPKRVALRAPAGAESFALSERLGALEDRRLYLVIRELQTNVQPEVMYNLYLNLPEQAEAEGQQAHLVGRINFFFAGGHGDHGDREPLTGSAEMPEKFVSFDVTEVARALQAAGGVSDDLTLTVAPEGTPAEEAEPVLGEVQLVEQ